MEHHLDFGVVRKDVVLGRLHLGATHVGRMVQNLPLQVGKLHNVEIDDADFADAGQRQVYGGGGAEAASPDNQRAGFHHLALAGAAHILHDDVSAVAFDLIWGQAKGLDHFGFLPVGGSWVADSGRAWERCGPLLQRKTRAPKPSGGNCWAQAGRLLIRLPPYLEGQAQVQNGGCWSSISPSVYRRNFGVVKQTCPGD